MYLRIAVDSFFLFQTSEDFDLVTENYFLFSPHELIPPASLCPEESCYRVFSSAGIPLSAFASFFESFTSRGILSDDLYKCLLPLVPWN